MAITWNITPDTLINAAARGLQRGVSAHVMEPSRVRYCPKRTGNLASTGEVVPPVIENGRITVTAQYTAPYAIYVHERNLRYLNGQWKYLSTPAYENIDKVADEVVAEINAAVK